MQFIEHRRRRVCEIALERERWKTGGNDKKKREREKSKSKLSVQNLCKNLGTKDLDSLVVLETC